MSLISVLGLIADAREFSAKDLAWEQPEVADRLLRALLDALDAAMRERGERIAQRHRLVVETGYNPCVEDNARLRARLEELENALRQVRKFLVMGGEYVERDAARAHMVAAIDAWVPEVVGRAASGEGL